MPAPRYALPRLAQHTAGAHWPRWLRRTLLRRVWLPAGLYRAMPWIYIGLGSACLAGGLFLPESRWLIPYVSLLGMACLHAAYLVAIKRRRIRVLQLRAQRSTR